MPKIADQLYHSPYSLITHKFQGVTGEGSPLRKPFQIGAKSRSEKLPVARRSANVLHQHARYTGTLRTD